jgi:predicted small metal-binding protein
LVLDNLKAKNYKANAENIVPGRPQMTRLFVDCRDYPSEMNCTVAISADTKEELVNAAVQHAVAVHGHQDSPQLREELAKMVKAQ